MTAHSGRLLILYARMPEPGKVKTRIAKHLGDEAASEIYRKFLDITVARMRTLCDAALRIDYYPDTPEASGYFKHRYPYMQCMPQSGVDLGSRMNHSLNRAFKDGFLSVCITGSDLPDLPMEYIHTAFESLTTHDLVVGPSTDGGYYLIGLRAPAPTLFEDIQWGAPSVLECTIEKAEKAKLSYSLLPQWQDVDTPADLHALQMRLRMNSDKNEFTSLKEMLNKIASERV
ncbi:MAG: TIGR04282 family arsenosugar biosynthesis glycosyltransferase [bacterium]